MEHAAVVAAAMTTTTVALGMREAAMEGEMFGAPATCAPPTSIHCVTDMPCDVNI